MIPATCFGPICRAKLIA